MLSDPEARRDYFSKLVHHEDGDHSEVKKVKNKINQLIEQEIALGNFKDLLTNEELTALESDTYNEVSTKSNFYFSIDENKKDKNLKVYQFDAPGNKYRHANVILPHEHCDIQNYVETSNLTQDKLFEIYAYYSLLVDMHIA